MSRFISYLNSAEKIISAYDAQVPFASYIKNYFSKNKKYGSGDRKSIASICYSYFRTGHLLNKNCSHDNLLMAVFLCTDKPNKIIDELKPQWSNQMPLSIEDKLQLITPSQKIEAAFPWINQLDKNCNTKKFCTSFFQQPALFIRVRPGQKNSVIHKLNQAGIPYLQKENDCVQLATGLNIETVIALDKEAVVQDYNSQKVLDYLRSPHQLSETEINVWDCCAASGGKSILAHDILQGKCALTMSDIRPGIIDNLKKRLAKAGVKHSSFITDLTQPVKLHKQFDIIICDAPCTGSGTWSRTPEQLYFFNPEAINEFSNLQKKIVTNVLPHIKAGGLFFYITCSVFKKENQDVTAYIQQKFNLVKLTEINLYGYDQMADSMFVSVFKNISS